MSTSGTQGTDGAYDAPDSRTMEVRATLNRCLEKIEVRFLWVRLAIDFVGVTVSSVARESASKEL